MASLEGWEDNYPEVRFPTPRLPPIRIAVATYLVNGNKAGSIGG